MGYLSTQTSRRGWRARLAVFRWPTWRGWNFIGNVLLILALWALGVVFINLGGPQRYANLAVGQRAPATVVASVEFPAVNVPATELARRKAMESVVPVFRIETGALHAGWRLFDQMASQALTLHTVNARTEEGEDAEHNGMKATVAAELDRTAEPVGVPLTAEEIEALFPAGRESETVDLLKRALDAVWSEGIVPEKEHEREFRGLAAGSIVDIMPVAEDDAASRNVKVEDLPSLSLAQERFVEDARAGLEETAGILATKKVLRKLAEATLQPNLVYNDSVTQNRQTVAARSVEPIMMTVRPGTTLMEERTPVLAQTVELITAYNRYLVELESPLDRIMKRLGDYALLLIVLVVCVGWLRSTQPNAYTKARRKWLLILLALLAIGMESLYHYVTVTLNWMPPWMGPYAIPLTLTTMIAALMAGPSAALATGLWVSLSASLLFDRSFEFLLLGLGGSVMATIMLRNVRKRSQVMRAGLAVGLVNAVMALALAVMYQHLPSTFLRQVLGGMASGVLAAILATLLLPLMEWMFRHTTDISLLELSDMAHPLLKRLALEAPGTYHHSLMVAAIGQAAADRIGADGLQVAVCAYFHDAGKLAKPEFFSENQRGGENPHDNLSPSMSALIIQSHVKEGVTLAKRHNLPTLVRDGIRTHHGTTLTSYFYQLAKQALKEAGMPEDPGLEHSFRYDGPRPWTREQAILMMADTVEAASRSLEKATPNRIAEMVETLLRDKLLDGQFDHCPITMEELNTVRESLIFSLTNTLHGRNPYPREDYVAQQPAASAPAPAGSTEAREILGGPGLSS